MMVSLPMRAMRVAATTGGRRRPRVQGWQGRPSGPSEAGWVPRRPGLWGPAFHSGGGGAVAYWVVCWCSCSAGGMSPSDSCRRSVLYQATYSTIASSSWVWVCQTRSRISSVLKLSTKLSASALTPL